MTFRSRFTFNPQQAAEDYVRRGDFKRAIEAFERAGDWRRAAQIASDVKDEDALVRCSLMAGVGKIPDGLGGDAAASSAAELLVSQKQYDLAIPLFELSWDFHRAAECAMAMRDPVRAARLYERAGDRLEAARCFQTAGKPKDALQLLEEGSKTTPGGLVPAGRAEEMLLLKADLLRQVGRESAAMELLSSVPPSPRIAELLERAGRLEDAVNCLLDLGDTEKASRVAAKSSIRDRLLARIYLRSGRPVEAANLFAQLGLAREAAEAYETARDWGRAAYRWEAARDLRRAAEAYEKAGRLRDASRCFEAAGLTERVAQIAARAAERVRKTPPPRAKTDALKQASAHLVSGEKARAASVLMQIQPHEAEFGRAVILLAPLLIEEGFCDDALSRLRQISMDSAAPLVLDRLYWEGRTLEAMGDKGGAQACYEKALALEPAHQPALERIELLRRPAEPEPMPADAVLAEGYRLAGRYDILSLLGHGGMSRVYKAHDRELGETVAIKTVLRPEHGGKGDEVRLLREVQICRKISHPNVVRVYDLGRFPGGIFVTMEYLEGQTLQQVLDKEAPLPLARVRDILIDVAAGLREAHALGVVHRDLKPANVILTANRAKILDFGIACIGGDVDGRLTQAGFVMGSPMYMSPDQLLGREVDGRSDLYSFGVLAYSLLAGREPFDNAEPTVLALKQIREAPPDIRGFRPDTPPVWAAFLGRLMEKEPEDRYPSAQAVLDVLETLPCPDGSNPTWLTCPLTEPV